MKIQIITEDILLLLPFLTCAKDVSIIYTNVLHAHVEHYKTL